MHARCNRIFNTLPPSIAGFAPFGVNPMVGPWPDTLDMMQAKNAAALVYEGQVWRLFTPIFLHAGLIHLAMNVLMQLRLGLYMELTWGPVVWGALYWGSGIASSLASAVLKPETISVGACVRGRRARAFLPACRPPVHAPHTPAHTPPAPAPVLRRVLGRAHGHPRRLAGTHPGHVGRRRARGAGARPDWQRQPAAGVCAWRRQSARPLTAAALPIPSALPLPRAVHALPAAGGGRH